MAESFNMTQEDSDLLVIAALAHDIKKHDDNGHFLRNHPLLASDYVCEIMEKFSEDVITNEQVQKICCAVSSHMGKWEGTREWVKDTTKELFPMPKNDFEKALQAADYIASRKVILDFDFAPIDNVVIPKIVTESKKEERDPNTYTIDELHSFVMPFGKHKGKTFKDVKETGYLYWMTLQDDFNAVDVQALAKRYLLLLGEKCGRYPANITLDTNNENDSKEADDLPF